MQLEFHNPTAVASHSIPIGTEYFIKFRVLSTYAACMWVENTNKETVSLDNILEVKKVYSDGTYGDATKINDTCYLIEWDIQYNNWEYIISYQSKRILKIGKCRIESSIVQLDS